MSDKSGKLRKEPDTMKGATRVLSVFLMIALILSCSACASGTGSETGKVEAGKKHVKEVWHYEYEKGWRDGDFKYKG